MSNYRIEVCYTGVGPRQGKWLLAFEHAGFTVNDKHASLDTAKQELTRLKQFAPQFRRPDTDWQARISKDGVEVVEPQPAKPEPKQKRKKSKAKPEPVTPDSFGGEDFPSDDKDFLNL